MIKTRERAGFSTAPHKEPAGDVLSGQGAERLTVGFIEVALRSPRLGDSPALL
jgi:hypothetical protein